MSIFTSDGAGFRCGSSELALEVCKNSLSTIPEDTPGPTVIVESIGQDVNNLRAIIGALVQSPLERRRAEILVPAVLSLIRDFA